MKVRIVSSDVELTSKSAKDLAKVLKAGQPNSPVHLVNGNATVMLPLDNLHPKFHLESMYEDVGQIVEQLCIDQNAREIVVFLRHLASRRRISKTLRTTLRIALKDYANI